MWVLSVTVCVGEWSGRWWSSVVYVHWRHESLWLVNRQRRSRVGRWLRPWSHSIAEQSATATTRPHWQHTLSSQAAVAKTIILQWTDVTTVRRTHHWAVVGVAWRHLYTETEWLTHHCSRQTHYTDIQGGTKSKPCMVYQKVVPKCANKANYDVIFNWSNIL